MTRLPIIRRDADGTIVDGTARARVIADLAGTEGAAGLALDDFRDLDGAPLDLPPGAAFEVQLAGGDPDAGVGSMYARFSADPPELPTEWPDPDQPWLGIDWNEDTDGI